MATLESSIRPILSSTRILFGLLPSLGSLILLRMVIHLYRPDIEDADQRIKDLPVDQLFEYYDFIIIGAGSAGSVVANRLSENPNWNILLLEAGQNENVLSELPVLFPALQTSTIDWQFVTEPSSEYCLSMVDNRCKWPRGKVLGGSSALNAMLYIRGNRKDYDTWAMQGNEGWAYEDIFKYFLKAEDMRIPEYQNDSYHSTGGPISIEHFKYEQPITKKILEAGEQLGYNIVDVNGEFQTGFTRSHGTLRDGLRCSTAKGYLRPASKRANLHISLHSLVEKILIDDYKRTYGVKFTKNGKSNIIKVNKEVILSAGTIQSPQILMLSGIGDSEELYNLGIYPINHLPGVGKNLQDHIAMGGHSFLFDNPYTNGSEYCFNLNTVSSIGSVIDFVINKKGPLYSMMEAEAMAFVNTKYQNPNEDYPDIQFFIAPTADNMDGGLYGKRANGLSDETYAELYEDILYQSSFSIVPLLLRPKSRGYIKLRDSNPNTPPLIYPNYYSDPEDMARMIEGARIAQTLIEQPALKELNARPNPNRNPGCKEHSLMSDEHLECQARHHSLTIYHPVGTCAMGLAYNPDAVVDPNLRVHGISNLRVVDGSIMPTIISGNTNAPIIMIAEKASDMIKEDWSESLNIEFYSMSKEKNSDAENTTNNRFQNDDIIEPRPNIFNEITSLFPYLSPDSIQYYVESITSKLGQLNVTDTLTRVKTKMELLEANITATCPLPFDGITGGLFLKAVSTVVAVHCSILDDFKWPPDISQKVIEEGSETSYDFIIVGAGTAGSLLASRLSIFYPTWKILLIEAGDNPGIDTEIPAFLFLNQNSSNDWFYKTYPDGNSCLGFENNSCIWSKGKGLGGSSSINAMIYLRGHPKDYSEWYNLGNPGWNYGDLITYFNDQEALFDIIDPDFEGYNNEWYKILDDAWNELNFTSYNYKGHETVLGTKKARLLTKDGKRMNTAKKYFKDADKLFVMKNTHVEKVIINPKNKQAYGVKIRHKSGVEMNILAKKEVILSAGSIATPQILMLSGVGPKSHLEEMGIKCIHDLSVGSNLQDHVILPLILKTNKNMTISSDIINLLLLTYMLTKTGPFSNIGITDYMGFINTNGNSDYPDIQFHYTYFTKNDDFVLKPYLEGLGYTSDIIQAIQELNKKHDFLGIYPTLLHPKSTGEILLSKPPSTGPIIKTNYFQHPDDVLSFLKAIDFVHKLEETSIFKEMEIELLNINIRKCNEHIFNTDNYWRCYISHMATTIYHPVGTAKMGPQDDINAVVNHELLVHGISNLRVVDASIMPTIPGGNTMAATLVIAQKAVDIIKKHYSVRDEL